MDTLTNVINSSTEAGDFPAPPILLVWFLEALSALDTFAAQPDVQKQDIFVQFLEKMRTVLSMEYGLLMFMFETLVERGWILVPKNTMMPVHTTEELERLLDQRLWKAGVRKMWCVEMEEIYKVVEMHRQWILDAQKLGAKDPVPYPDFLINTSYDLISRANALLINSDLYLPNPPSQVILLLSANSDLNRLPLPTTSTNDAPHVPRPCRNTRVWDNSAVSFDSGDSGSMGRFAAWSNLSLRSLTTRISRFSVYSLEIPRQRTKGEERAKGKEEREGEGSDVDSDPRVGEAPIDRSLHYGNKY